MKPKVCNFMKREAPTQVCSFKFCKILKNTFFYTTFPVAASTYLELKHSHKKESDWNYNKNQVHFLRITEIITFWESARKQKHQNYSTAAS